MTDLRDLLRPQALRPPAVGIASNPLQALTSADMRPAREGATVYSLRPRVQGALRCYLNGEPLYPITPRQYAHHQRLLSAGREDEARAYLWHAVNRGLNWQRTTVRAGDILVWHEVTQSKGTFQALIVVAAIAAAVYTGGSSLTVLMNAAKFAAIGLAVGNLLLPAPSPSQLAAGKAAEDVFTTSLSGNTARLDAPIWKVCGTTKLTPPFAAQPYYEFVHAVHPNGSESDEQYYYAVFAIGVGNHDLLAAFIGKTAIGNFQDVLVAQYLAPGVQPSRALCSVVSSTEVSALVLDSGVYVGPYVACQPMRKMVQLGIDVACPQGLGLAGHDGPDGELQVEWSVFGREIDDYGRVLTAWVQLLDITSPPANTNTPLRWSYVVPINPTARMEIRLVRRDLKNTDPAARHELQWVGMRAYLDQAATLNPDTAHYEIVMRASEQLSANSQRDFSMIVQAKVRTWAPETGWGPEVATRNPAWWLADLWTNPVWGEGLPDDRIDLAGLYAWAQVCDARQDRFDFAFTDARNAWDAAQVIARAGRARCFRRFGVNTLVRDAIVTLPSTAFTYRNTVPRTMEMSESLPTRDAADGYVIEYTSNVLWDTATIECPCPGVSVTDPDSARFDPDLPPMAKPIFLRLEGIQGATHAQREGMYEAAVMLWRRRVAKCKTEMQGVVTAYGEAARWMPEIAGYGLSGDVVALDGLVMTLSEPVDFGTEDLYLRLLRDDGSLTDPVVVSPGASANQIVLPAAPDFDIVTDDGRRERPKFLLGTLVDADELVKVTAIADGGKASAEDGMDGAQLYDITAVVDDDRVHLVDVPLLPGPGDIQDPIILPSDGPGDGPLLVIASIDDEYIESFGFTDIDCSSTYTLTNTGLAYQSGVGLVMFTKDHEPETNPYYVNQWSLYGAIEPAQAAGFEVRATFIKRIIGPDALVWTGPGPDDGIHQPWRGTTGGDASSLVLLTGDPLDTWLSLDTTRSWTAPFDAAAGDAIEAYSTETHIRIEIRDAATSILQSDAEITLYCRVR